MSTTGRDRSTLSCARCYLMKKKCDKKSPSCSRCTRAGTPCLGINRSDGTEVPRSAVRFLERRLADIENDPSHLRRAGPSFSTDQPASIDRGSSDRADEIYNSVLQVAGTAIGLTCTQSLLKNHQGIYYEAKLFYPSERPPLKIPVGGSYHEDPPRRASRGCVFRLPDMAALRIPFEVTKALFNNYISNILPKYPCFDEIDLVDQFNRFYATGSNEGQTLTDTTCFIVSMVLAISSLTSKAHDFRKVASLSESLQRDAMRRSGVLRTTSVRSLQCFLLLIQMALLLPYTSNLWYMSGEAMRMAIALGLHQEQERGAKMDPLQTQLRRRMFWTVYQLERTIAIASGCPLAISDEHISTLLPSHSPADTPEIRRPHRTKMGQFLSQVQLCQIQSEIHGVQFFDQRLPKDALDYEDWVRKIENSIQAWQQSSASDGGLPGWSVIAANHCRLLLYRPCSRNIVPPEASLRAASATAISMINGYWNLVQIGNLVFSFEYVYNVFQAGMVLLYALRNHFATVQESSLENEAYKALDLLVQLFGALSERWPVAADTGHYINDLKDSILRYINSGEGRSRSAYDINLLAELDFMVTQRRIHSLYHRNVEVLTPEERKSSEPILRAQSDSFTPFPDELWQEFIDTGFQYLADDSLLFFGSPEAPQATPPDDHHSIATNPTTSAQDSKSAMDAEMLIKSLPACGFCRKQHIKCDREFPSCTACRKSDRECTYYDAVLQQDIPRGYVYSLYERLTEVAQNGSSESLAPRSLESTQLLYPGSGLGCNVFVPCNFAKPGDINLGIMQTENSEAWKDLDNWFFGRSSALAYMQRAISSKPKFISTQGTQKGQTGQDLPMDGSTRSEYQDVQPPPMSVATALFRLFSRSVNLFYPTMTKFHLDNIISNMYQSQNVTISHDRDIFYLIISIACQVVGGSVPGLVFTPEMYFQKATRYQEGPHQSGTNFDQLFLLQKSLLIAIYLLLNPEAGDVWRNLGFAIRLYFDLSHRPSEQDGMDEELMNMLSRTLYCLECQVSIASGRPSLLVIGDTLRESMTKSVSTTIEEHIAIYFYRISLLKMQIHSTLLSGSENRTQPITLRDDHQNYRQELETWHRDWEQEMASAAQESHIRIEGGLTLFEAWGHLNYHHTALLVSNLSSATSRFPLNDCDQVIRWSGVLTRHQRRLVLPRLFVLEQPLVPIFPTDWTLAHLIFSLGLNLSSHERQYAPGAGERFATVGRCLATLALLEGNPATLSLGFSELLEGLLYDKWSDDVPTEPTLNS